MRSDFTPKDEFRHLLAALTLPNRLALETSLYTGLRISDVLNLKSTQLKSRFSVRESKTGKIKHIYLPNSLLFRLKSLSGRVYVFEHRFTPLKCRTRQAVYKDLNKVKKLLNHSSEAVTLLYAMADTLANGNIPNNQKRGRSP